VASTNVLYYAGSSNGSIYQVYRDDNFEVGNTRVFHIVQATPLTFDDHAASSLVFKKNHLYYRSSVDNQLYNLFYIDTDIIDCIPNYIREGVSFGGKNLP